MPPIVAVQASARAGDFAVGGVGPCVGDVGDVVAGEQVAGGVDDAGHRTIGRVWPARGVDRMEGWWKSRVQSADQGAENWR